MGFFSRLFGKKQAPQIARIQGDGKFALDVVGESHHQTELNRIAGGKTPDGHRLPIEALLIYDDNNPHDANAIAVAINGELIGHLNRDNARQFRRRMKEAGAVGVPGVCNALIVGGWKRSKTDEGHYGVKLDIPLDT